jgi:bifunctional DNase/RNase
MVRVVISSIRVSLMSPHRVILLKEVDSERQLPIWIGPFETDAIVVELQQIETARPLTHDLLKTVITELGGTVSHVTVNALRDDYFTARVIIDKNGDVLEIDSRPSDAIACPGSHIRVRRGDGGGRRIAGRGDLIGRRQ